MKKNRLISFSVFLLLFFACKSEAQVPSGYKLVWSDEFNDSRLNGDKPSLRQNKSDWWYETGGGGWGNNEQQCYVSGITTNNDTLAAITNGTLKIKAIRKTCDGLDYASIRMNTTQSWLYGYFEVRAKLPSGRGVWPAFWMLPKNFKSWPLDGEIDIMEYVGYEPDLVHASIHTKAYNHTIGTQRTSTKKILNAESEFHTYGIDWTESCIRAYVDGELYFTYMNDGAGNKNTWPFNVPFYLKLNLAVGGNWGGVKGVDTQIFPATYEVDYVRVYQSNSSEISTKAG